MAAAQHVERDSGRGRERVCQRTPGADLRRGLGTGSRPALHRPGLPAGMDYHRLRPQSVPHASPKRGVSQAGDGVVTIDLPGPVLDPEADAHRVYHLPIDAMVATTPAMGTIRHSLAHAARAAGP